MIIAKLTEKTGWYDTYYKPVLYVPFYLGHNYYRPMKIKI
jgi:hypothetical protein